MAVKQPNYILVCTIFLVNGNILSSYPEVKEDSGTLMYRVSNIFVGCHASPMQQL